MTPSNNPVSALGRQFTSYAGTVFRAADKPLRFLIKGLKKLFGFLMMLIVMPFAPKGAGKKEYAKAVCEDTADLLRHPSHAAARLKEKRKNYRFTGKALAFWLLPLLAAAALTVGIRYCSGLTFALEIRSGDRTLGYTANENEFLAAVEDTEKLFSSDGKNTELSLPALSYRLSLIRKDGFTDRDTLTAGILSLTDQKTEYACGVFVDGKFLCAVRTEDEARNAFDAVLTEAKAQEENEGAVVSFNEKIEYKEGVYPASSRSIWTKDRLARTLKTYTEDGRLNIRTVKTVISNEVVGFDTLEIDTDQLYSGTMRLISEGQDGVAQITSLATYINGNKTESRELSRLTVKEPIAQRMQVGTRNPITGYNMVTGYTTYTTYTTYTAYTTYAPAQQVPTQIVAPSTFTYGGNFIWPVDGAYNINSDYEERWGTFHAGIDIGMGDAPGTSLGKTVVAAADGVIEAATTHSSYGYYVKIDHGNGIETLYGHLLEDSFMVSAGERVVAGQPIARVGQTGYATGPHLHFEVRVNGDRVDPKPYLGV